MTETLEQAGFKLVKVEGNVAILADNVDGVTEIWVKNNNIKEYALVINGGKYGYSSTMQ